MSLKTINNYELIILTLASGMWNWLFKTAHFIATLTKRSDDRMRTQSFLTYRWYVIVT